MFVSPKFFINCSLPAKHSKPALPQTSKNTYYKDRTKELAMNDSYLNTRSYNLWCNLQKKAIYWTSGYICHLYNWYNNYIVQLTRMYKFLNKMALQVHFKGDFVRKILCRRWA